jgi:hypothetical protein
MIHEGLFTVRSELRACMMEINISDLSLVVDVENTTDFPSTAGKKLDTQSLTRLCTEKCLFRHASL